MLIHSSNLLTMKNREIQQVGYPLLDTIHLDLTPHVLACLCNFQIIETLQSRP